VHIIVRFIFVAVGLHLCIGSNAAISEGAVDSDFRPNIEFRTNLVLRPLVSLAVQQDGKILVGGNFDRLNGAATQIARLNRDGSTDRNFDGALRVDNMIGTWMKRDGKVYAYGSFTDSKGSREWARFNSDGSYDENFPLRGGFTWLEVQSDGKILISGHFSKGFYGAPCWYFARFQNNGEIDSSFNPNVPETSALSLMGGPIVVQPDGKILVGRYLPVGNGAGIKRFLSDGSFDYSFGPQLGTVWNFDMLHDGSFLAGVDGNEGYSIYRISPNGNAGRLPFAKIGGRYFSSAFAIGPDDKIFVSKTVFEDDEPEIMRLNRDGSVDTGFLTGHPGDWVNTDEDAPYWVRIAPEQDGSLLVGGNFKSFNGIACNGLVRLLGTADLVCNTDTSTGEAVVSVFGPGNVPFGLEATETLGTSWTEVHRGVVGQEDARVTIGGSKDLKTKFYRAVRLESK
jgi:uncharacterized delta-60 repeat protein